MLTRRLKILKMTHLNSKSENFWKWQNLTRKLKNFDKWQNLTRKVKKTSHLLIFYEKNLSLERSPCLIISKIDSFEKEKVNICHWNSSKFGHLFPKKNNFSKKWRLFVPATLKVVASLARRLWESWATM